ncbi:hypothetical protein ACIQAC_01355 [Streptomyces sp. NPDC088387]|uniref:hypothetical protein n=1 Tax=Streptomyces sp. NPDC088387 TaxID=3365859 RepID=UPI003813391B
MTEEERVAELHALARRDYGTPTERAARAEAAIAQAETAKWHAKAAAEAPRGRR